MKTLYWITDESWPYFIYRWLGVFSWQIFEKISDEIKGIQTNCNFDKGGTDKIRRDLEIVMRQMHDLKYGDNEGLRVLIFDDEDESASMLAERINVLRDDSRITISTNMINALHQVRFGNYDVVFADQRHHTEEYGTVLNSVMNEQDIKTKFILYSGGEKPEKYKGIFLDKLEIMKNPDTLKEFL